LGELEWVAMLRPPVVAGKTTVLSGKVRAIELILAYGHGRPTQPFEGSLSLDWSKLSTKQLEAVRAALAALGGNP